jgi:hypothetical protein
MHIHPSRLLTILVLVVAWLAAASAQDTYTLQHKFEQGKTYHYSATANSKVDQEMGGMAMHVTSEAWFVPNIVLEKMTPEGNLVLVYSADSAKTHLKMPNMDTTMVLNNIVGKRTRLTVTPRGEILKRETIDSVKTDRMMTGIGLRELVRLPRLAAGPVKMGDKWNVTQVDTNELGGGKIVTTTNIAYTLAGKEKMQNHDCLKVTYTGTSATAGKGSMRGLDLFVEGTGKTSGTFYFDADKGMFVRNEAKAESETTMAATGEQNMTIPISSTTSTVLSLKE